MILDPIRPYINLIIAAALVAVGLYITTLRSQLDKKDAKIAELNGQVAVAQANNNTLKGNIQICSDTNEANLEVIKKLQAERRQSELAVAALAKKETNVKETAETLQKTIRDLSAVPANDGPSAKILVDTLSKIEELRK